MYTAEASVFVDADPQTAWDYVSNYQNFDQFMPNVKEVKMIQGDTSEWHLSGPLGIPVSWQAITSVQKAPSHLAWHSVKGSIDTKGFIKIEPANSSTGSVGNTLGAMNAQGSRITVHMEYTPPLGAVGEAFASLFKDPQKMLEAGLEKLADLLSSGSPKALNKEETRQVDAEIGSNEGGTRQASSGGMMGQNQSHTDSSLDPDWDVNRDRVADGTYVDERSGSDRSR
jgi:uncharacterized membrane protein